MSLFSRALDFVTGTGAAVVPPPAALAAAEALAVRGAFEPDRVLPGNNPRVASWATVDGGRLLDTARKSVVVYACLSYLADAVAESPIRVYRAQGGERKEVPDHRCRRLLANPNPQMSEAEFLALVVMAMGMQGYAVVELVRSAANLPVELWPLRPDWLTPRLDPMGRRTRLWEYRIPGADRRLIPSEDLIVVPYRHDDRQERPGVSPLQVAAREVGIDSQLTEFLMVYLQSGGVPPFVIEYDQPLQPHEIEQMQESWAQKYGGSRAFGKIPIFHGGYRIGKVGDSLNAMAWPDLRAITEDKICQAFRVPRELIQTHSTAAGGNGLTTTEQEGAMASLQRYGATPLRNRIDGAFTRTLLAEFTGGDPSYELAFDVSDVLALQEDQDKRHQRVRADWDSGLVMLDEARAELGMQPLPKGQGQVFKVPFTASFLPAGELAAPPPAPAPALSANTPPKAARRTYRDLKALSSDDLDLRARAVLGNRRAQGKLAQILDRKLRGLFAAQADRIAGAIAKGAGRRRSRA